VLHDLDASAWVKGRLGGALDLGRVGWLECPLPEVRAGVPIDLSVAVWIKQARPREFSALFTRQLPAGDNAALFWFGLRKDRLTVWSGSWDKWTSSTLAATDRWVHVAFVHADRETRLYVDGVLVGFKTGQLPRGEGLVQGPVTIGGSLFKPRPGRVQHHFDGVVDEAMIYHRALTGAEVAALARL
jgi:hypothetical protein